MRTSGFGVLLALFDLLRNSRRMSEKNLARNQVGSASQLVLVIGMFGVQLLINHESLPKKRDTVGTSNRHFRSTNTD